MLVATSALVSAFDEAGIIQVIIEATYCCTIMLEWHGFGAWLCWVVPGGILR